MTTSSNEAKTPLANVSSLKDSSESADQSYSDFTEDYIRSLNWSAQATNTEKTLVGGNIRSFASVVAKRFLDPLKVAVFKYFEIDPAKDAEAWSEASHELLRLASPTTQECATASAPTTTVPGRQASPSESSSPPDAGVVQKEPEFKGVVCRGDFSLGTACGRCERCLYRKQHRKPESESSISSTLAEIRERQADGYEKVSKGHIGDAAVAAINDVRILRGIISSLQGEIKELQNENAALMRIVVNAAEEDCLRGRRVHCAELETNAADWCVACQAKYVLKETK